MSERRVFEGRLISVRLSGRYEIVEHPGSVAVLAVDAEDRVVLTPQRRPAVGREQVLEIPAGTLDVAGESAADAARRELEEETGLRCERLERLIAYFPSPGYTNERQELYLATGLSGELHDAELVPLQEAVARVERGEIEDLKTAFAILLAARILG